MACGDHPKASWGLDIDLNFVPIEHDERTPRGHTDGAPLGHTDTAPLGYTDRTPLGCDRTCLGYTDRAPLGLSDRTHRRVGYTGGMPLWRTDRTLPLHSTRGLHVVKPGLGKASQPVVGGGASNKGAAKRQRRHRAPSAESSSRPCAHTNSCQQNQHSHCDGIPPGSGGRDYDGDSECAPPEGNHGGDCEYGCDSSNEQQDAARGVSCGAFTPCCSDFDPPARHEASVSNFISISPTPTPLPSSMVNTTPVSGRTSLTQRLLAPEQASLALRPPSAETSGTWGPFLTDQVATHSLTHSLAGAQALVPGRTTLTARPSSARAPGAGLNLPPDQMPPCPVPSGPLGRDQVATSPLAAARVLAMSRNALLVELMRLQAEEIVLTNSLRASTACHGARVRGGQGPCRSADSLCLKRKRQGGDRRGGEQHRGEGEVGRGGEHHRGEGGDRRGGKQRKRQGEEGPAWGAGPPLRRQHRRQENVAAATLKVHPAQSQQRSGTQDARLASHTAGGSMRALESGAGCTVAARARLAAAAVRLCDESPRLPLLSRVQRQQLLALVGDLVRVVERRAR